MTTSLKVPVATLIAKAESERSRIIAAHRLSVDGYADNFAEACEALAVNLEILAKRARAGKLRVSSRSRYRNGKYRDCIEASAFAECNTKPPAKADTKSVDRDLALLRATSQETISVRLDSDFARYL